MVVLTGRTSASVSRRTAELGASGEAVDPHDAAALEAFFARTGSFDHLAVTLGTQAITTVFEALPEEQIVRAIEDKLLTYTRTLRAALPCAATQQRADRLGSSKAGEPASRSRDSAGNVWCLGENATSVRYSRSR